MVWDSSKLKEYTFYPCFYREDVIKTLLIYQITYICTSHFTDRISTGSPLPSINVFYFLFWVVQIGPVMVRTLLGPGVLRT